MVRCYLKELVFVERPQRRIFPLHLAQARFGEKKGAACPSEHHFHMSCCQCFSVSAFTFLFFRANDFLAKNTWRMWQAQRFSRLRLTIRVPRFPYKVPSLRACVYQHCGFCGQRDVYIRVIVVLVYRLQYGKEKGTSACRRYLLSDLLNRALTEKPGL